MSIGLRGYQGFQGFQGAKGTQGGKGGQGDDGPQGARGAQGFLGNQGVPGNQGPLGAQGAQGSQGSQGTASTVPGPQGVPGSVGPMGPVGPTGPAGSGSGGSTLAPGVYPSGKVTIVYSNPYVDISPVLTANIIKQKNIFLTYNFSTANGYFWTSVKWPMDSAVNIINELGLTQDGHSFDFKIYYKQAGNSQLMTIQLLGQGVTTGSFSPNDIKEFTVRRTSATTVEILGLNF